MGLIFDITNTWDINNFIFLIMDILLCVFGRFAAKGEYLKKHYKLCTMLQSFFILQLS